MNPTTYYAPRRKTYEKKVENKAKIRAQLEADVEAFLKEHPHGIQQIASGVSGDPVTLKMIAKQKIKRGEAMKNDCKKRTWERDITPSAGSKTANSDNAAMPTAPEGAEKGGDSNALSKQPHEEKTIGSLAAASEGDPNG